MPHSSEGDLLIVRHGPGRGRLPGFRREVLRWLEAETPALWRRIRVHDTGGPRPPLEGIRAVVFWLADPLRELYPADYAEAMEIAEVVGGVGGGVVNHPAALSSTIKSDQSRTWREAGIPCADCRPIVDHRELAGAVAATGLPAIIRTDLHHAQEDTHFCLTEADVAQVPASGRLYPAVAIPFIDVRAEYHRERPGTVWAALWHKKRAFVFGDIVVPNHTLFAPEPIVGLRSATFHRYRNYWALLTPLVAFRRWDRDALLLDRAYSEAAPEHPDLMKRAVRTLGLECAAVDYCTRADGSLIFWEVNPYFSLPVGKAMGWARDLRSRNQRFYLAVARHFASLLGEPGLARPRAGG